MVGRALSIEHCLRVAWHRAEQNLVWNEGAGLVAERKDTVNGDGDVLHGVALGGIEFHDIDFKWTELRSGSILLYMLKIFETGQSVELIC